MSLVQWHPLREMDDLLSRFQRTGLSLRNAASEEVWAPVVDISESPKQYAVKADLPGVKKEDISVSVDGNVVSIEASTQGSTDSKGGKVLFNERHYGQMSRSFTLDKEVDEDKATGKYADGVLTLELPKKPGAPKPEAKQIAIE